MKVLRRLLDYEEQEDGKVLLLLAFGFFIGIFNVTFLVQSSSAFLNVFNEKVDLPKAIIFSGILGVFSAWLFSYLQNRISFVSLTVSILVIILTTVTLLRVGYAYSHYSRQLIFFSYVIVGPCNAISLLLFWGIVGRLFSVRQTKRIIGSIDSGQLVGTILASFTIPVVLRFMFNSVNLLVISSVSVFFATIIFLALYFKFPFDLIKISTDKSVQKEHNFYHLIRKKYLIAMAGFIVISMIATIFVDYSFLQVTAKNYPDEKDLAIFLARFEGTILIFSFLVQTFVTDRLISMYGLKITLFVTPVVLLIFTVLTMIVGVSLEYGKAFDAFILFFLSVSLSKLFNTALRDSIDSPTFKLYFLPFDSAIRLDVQTKIEGVVKLFAGLLAGLILISIEAITFFSVTHITLFLLLIIAAWLFVTSKLHKKYKETLQNTLSNFKRKEEKVYKTEHTLANLLKKELHSENPQKVLSTIHLIENLYPAILEDVLRDVAGSNNLDLQNYAINKLKMLRTNYEEESQEQDEEMVVLKQLNDNSSSGFLESGNLIKRLVKSKIPKDRVVAAKLFRFPNNSEHLYLFNDLLKDYDKEVVTTTIYTLKQIKHPETFPSLIELLAIPEFSSLVTGVLIGMGDEIIPALELAFQRPGQKETVLYKIIYIYGQIGSEKAIEKLWLKISYPDFQIVSMILRSFYYWKVKPNEQQENIVKTILENEIRKVAWNISAQEEVVDEPQSKYLKQALEEEINLNFDIIYILLSLLYEEQSIQLVRDNIEAGTSEGRVFALELLDIFIAKDIKTTLFPLLDDLPVSEKIRNLQLHFPREIFDSVEVLKQIINRDYNNIGRWTKACALYAYALTPRAGISDDLIANFFNPNFLIRETAAWAVVKKDKTIFRHILTRIVNQKNYNNESVIKELSSFIDGENTRVLRIDKIMFLKEISFFSNLPGIILAELVEEVKEVKVKEGAEIQLKDKGNAPFYIVYKGLVALFKNDQLVGNVAEKNVVGDMELMVNEGTYYKVVAYENTLLFSIDRLKLYEFMTKYYQFANNYITTLNLSISEEEQSAFSRAS